MTTDTFTDIPPIAHQIMKWRAAEAAMNAAPPQPGAIARLLARLALLAGRARERLPDVYASVDAFVFPSTTDTFGLVLLEACAAGIRVAAMPAP